MRFIVSAILFTLCYLCSFAQRVNEYGLKMVSEIEYFDKDICHLFKFKYDEKNRLTRMTVYRNDKLYRDFVKTSEGLTVIDYDTYNYSPLRWETSFDTYGNISSIAVFEEFAPKAIKRDVFNFFYERDGFGYPFRLSRYNHTETSKRKGQQSWYGTTVGTLYTEIFYKDGFLIEGKESDIGKFYSIDYAHINDTNMNLLYFFSSSNSIGGMNMAYFSITEWLCFRSKYFIDKEVYIGGYLKYSYKYDNNNLIEIEEFINGNYVRKKVILKYLH